MFRFTIRDVLWLTVVVAILALWSVERATREAEELQRYPRSNEQAEAMRKLNERYRNERQLRLKAENQIADLKAELENAKRSDNSK